LRGEERKREKERRRGEKERRGERNLKKFEIQKLKKNLKIKKKN
jgi:hypothetical protein